MALLHRRPAAVAHSTGFRQLVARSDDGMVRPRKRFQRQSWNSENAQIAPDHPAIKPRGPSGHSTAAMIAELTMLAIALIGVVRAKTDSWSLRSVSG